MRYTEPNSSEPDDMVLDVEDQLRQEIESLKRQLDQHTPAIEKPPHPSRTGLWLLALGIAVLIAAAFFGGYIPRVRREASIGAESREQEQTLPVVSVVRAVRSGTQSQLVLPGNIQAVTEAPILARADGYIKKRYVDIGDRVKQGQLLAELEAPELDQQVQQAKANLQQAQAALEQASASYAQGKANTELANVTAKRYNNLSGKGVVSRQENDQYQAQYEAQAANLQALEKAIAAAKSNIASSEANLSRLEDLQGYKMVKAPFSGVITVRNVDTGALVSPGNTLLFRIAQTDMLRVYVNVPQANASSVRVGQLAQLRIADQPNSHFTGRVTRTSNALDPASRTLLTEVQVANPNGALMPGTYAMVGLSSARTDPPLLLSSGALVVRSDGTQVAVVRADHTVHFQHITVGRDYGDRLEVTSGLEDGDSVIVNPSDSVREGVKVNPVSLTEKSAAK